MKKRSQAPISLPLPSGLDVALIGVPYDSGANHPGTRLGPKEIRNKSSVVRRCAALPFPRLRSTPGLTDWRAQHESGHRRAPLRHLPVR